MLFSICVRYFNLSDILVSNSWNDAEARNFVDKFTRLSYHDGRRTLINNYPEFAFKRSEPYNRTSVANTKLLLIIIQPRLMKSKRHLRLC